MAVTYADFDDHVLDDGHHLLRGPSPRPCVPHGRGRVRGPPVPLSLLFTTSSRCTARRSRRPPRRQRLTTTPGRPTSPARPDRARAVPGPAPPGGRPPAQQPAQPTGKPRHLTLALHHEVSLTPRRVADCDPLLRRGAGACLPADPSRAEVSLAISRPPMGRPSSCLRHVGPETRGSQLLFGPEALRHLVGFSIGRANTGLTGPEADRTAVSRRLGFAQPHDPPWDWLHARSTTVFVEDKGGVSCTNLLKPP